MSACVSRVFYDDVLPATDADLALLAELPDAGEHLKEVYGVREFLAGSRVSS